MSRLLHSPQLSTSYNEIQLNSWIKQDRSWLLVGRNFERYTELKKIIALLRLAIGSSVERKVGIAIRYQVEDGDLDTVFEYCCMKEVDGSIFQQMQVFRELFSTFLELLLGISFIVFEERVQLIKSYTVKISCLFSNCDKPTPLGLKMIHKLRIDLHRRDRAIFLCSFDIGDESVDVNWQSEKKDRVLTGVSYISPFSLLRYRAVIRSSNYQHAFFEHRMTVFQNLAAITFFCHRLTEPGGGSAVGDSAGGGGSARWGSKYSTS
ncbi:hypothetical protein Tco_0941361 [Tanacetum coccineum]|uniref:Uncharacterized protein n=1 Tax=Tanacetum coccineum TaxID=301880 RepID=A0ABQ5DQP2_9ASTR